MRSFKKALAFVLTLALVLSSMAVAFADTNTSTYPDVNGTDYATAVNTLTSLGVVSGYPDGTFGVNDNLNRAQVAKMIVLTLGLGNAADNAKSISKFSDVKPGDWFAGYVNVAASLGIVKGYGNGKFGPNDNVTYPQVLIMLIRALGYKDSDVITSPDNYILDYIVKAGQLGITDGVTVNTGVATRGDTAKLFYNALSANIVTGRNTDGSPIVSETKTLLTKLASVATYTVLSTPSVDSSVSAGYVVTKENGKVATTVNLDDYLGKKIDAYVAGSKIVAVKDVSTSDDDILTFTASQDSVANTVYYKDGDTDKTVTVADSTPVVYNGVKTTFGDVRANQKVYTGANVTLVNNDGNAGYDYMVVNDSFKYQAVVVNKDVLSGDKYINNTSTLSIDPSKTIIVKGSVSKVTDIKANDVIYYGTSIDGNKIVILVVRNKVSGKVTEQGSDYVVINGTKYTVKGISVPSVNTEGTWVLDKDNNIVYEMPGATTPTYYAIALLSDLNNAWNSKIKLFKSDGNTVVMDAVYDNVKGVTVNPDELVEYTVNSDGKIDSIAKPAPTDVVSNVSGAVYTADNKIIVGGTTYYINSNTVLFNKKTDGTYEVIKLSDILDKSTNTVTLVKDEYNVVKVALFTNANKGTTEAATKTVLVKTYAAIDGGVRIYVDENGVEKTYDSTTYTTSSFKKNTFYKLTFDANNKVIGKQELSPNATDVIVKAIDAANYKVQFGTSDYRLIDTNVVIYQLNADGTYSIKGLGDVTVDTKVDYYLNDNAKVSIIVIK